MEIKISVTVSPLTNKYQKVPWYYQWYFGHIPWQYYTVVFGHGTMAIPCFLDKYHSNTIVF